MVVITGTNGYNLVQTKYILVQTRDILVQMRDIMTKIDHICKCLLSIMSKFLKVIYMLSVVDSLKREIRERLVMRGIFHTNKKKSASNLEVFGNLDSCPP